nr:hypothetical protein [uncultured bacterium]
MLSAVDMAGFVPVVLFCNSFENDREEACLRGDCLQLANSIPHAVRMNNAYFISTEIGFVPETLCKLMSNYRLF